MSRHVAVKMPTERRPSRLSKLGPIVSVLTLGACASVLGIEDIHDGPAPGAAGDGTGNETSGGTTTGGKNGGGGNTNGGKDSGDGGSEEPTSGVGNIGGTEPGGGGTGEGGAPPVDDPTVRGRVIDFWGQTISGVPVQIGNTLVSTDGDGKFEFADVPAEYEVSLAIELTSITSHGYVWQGLTRRDPTLQVYSGIPYRSGSFDMAALDVTVGTNQKAVMSIGAPGGDLAYTADQTGLTNSTFYWDGGATVNGTAHALYWQYGAKELPSAYLGIDATTVGMSDTDSTTIAFQLVGDPLDDGTLQGTVTPATGTDRENHVYLRFTSGDAIEVVSETDGPDAFTYLVPTAVPGGSVTASASEGDADTGEYAVAHASGLAAGGTTTLKIPQPGSLVAPVSDVANVDLTTNFAYLAGAGSSGTHVVVFRSTYDSCCYDAIFVATTKTQLTIPTVVGSNFLKGGEDYYWRVETHGKIKTVDDMAGPTGYMDAFSLSEAYYEAPSGFRTQAGQYAITAGRIFTAKP